MRVTPDLLKKYHLGHCTEEEREAIQNWLADANISDLQKDCPDIVSETNISQSQTKIWQTLKEQTYEDNLVTKKLKPNRLRYIAASIIFFAIATASIVWYISPKADISQKMISIHVQYGHKRQLKLSDGTTVHLHPGATLNYPEKFSGSTREIELIGQAYFEVSADKHKPFLIHTAYNTAIKVVGTAFNVKAEERNSTVQVSVSEGVVHFMKSQNNADYIELTPGQSAIYDNQTALFSRQEDVPSQIGAWRYGTMVFEEETVENIMPKIAQWYGYSIKVDNTTLLNKKYSAKYESLQLEELLKSMAFVLDYNYLIDHEKKTVTIH